MIDNGNRNLDFGNRKLAKGSYHSVLVPRVYGARAESTPVRDGRVHREHGDSLRFLCGLTPPGVAGQGGVISAVSKFLAHPYIYSPPQKDR